MTLEDFFTPSEMKDGIMAIARVEELLGVMQKESSCAVKNFAEVARKWSSVGSTLAATDNKSSLDLFIQLDGVCFLNRWLQEAQKCCDNIYGVAVEESINMLLGALEKLPIDQECSKSSGIAVTVKNLFSHKSSRVQDRARALFSNWNQGMIADTGNSNHEPIGNAEDFVQEPAKGDTSCKPFILADMDCGFQDTLASKRPAQGTTSTEALGSPVSGKPHVQGESSDILKPIEFTSNTKRTNSLNICSQKSDPLEVATALTTARFQCGSSTSDLPAQELLKDPTPSSHVDVKWRDSNIWNVLSSNRDILSKPENPESSFSRMKATGSVQDVNKLIVEVGTADVLKLKMEIKDSHKSDTKSDNGLDFGIEGGPKVATELKQEVGDVKEAPCNFSEEISYKTLQSGSLDTVNEKPIHGIDAVQNPSGGVSSQKGKEHMFANLENSIQGRVSFMVAENTQEVPCNSDKGMLGFDLNEIHPKEMDCPNTPISAPVSSQAAVQAPPVVSLGSDGSAVTSAFCSAYSRRTLNGLILESLNVLDIDLNVVEGGVDGVADAVLMDQIPASSSLLSGESSIEVTSRRAERLNVDLNCLADHDDAPTSHVMGRESFYNHLDGQHSSSLAPFSSLLKQPFKHKIDLNENISFLNDTNDQPTDPGQSSYQGMSDCGGFEQHDSAVMLFGTRLELDTKYSAPASSNKPNVHVEDSAMHRNLAKPQGFVDWQHAVACAPSPFGYNGLTMRSSISLSAACGPAFIPYMVDSSGAPVMPQMLSPAMVIPTLHSLQPFHVSVNSLPLEMNRVGPTHAGFDLNSNLMMVEGGASELEGSRPGRSQLEECMWSTPHCLSLGMGLKRKEPDGGWESYPVSNKQQRIWQ